MSKNTSGSGAPDDQSGASVDDQSNQTDQSKDKKTVTLEAHERALADMHKYKKQVAEFNKRFQDQEEERLRKEKNFEALADQYKKTAEETEVKLANTNKAFISTLKDQAVRSIAAKHGIRPEAEADLELISLDAVEVETTSTGKFRVMNAEDFVQNLKKSKPHWFKEQKAPTFNGGGGSGKPVDSKLSYDEWKALPLNEMKKRMADVAE